MQREQIEIAIRLYENKKLGNTYAKGRRHTAVFNAAADLQSPQVKYLLDYHPFNAWQHTAKSDVQIELADIVREKATKDTLASWVMRYDPATKTKSEVIGYSSLNMQSHHLELVICDQDAGVETAWRLPAKPCKYVRGKNVPVLLATNADLGTW